MGTFVTLYTFVYVCGIYIGPSFPLSFFRICTADSYATWRASASPHSISTSNATDTQTHTLALIITQVFTIWRQLCRYTHTLVRVRFGTYKRVFWCVFFARRNAWDCNTGQFLYCLSLFKVDSWRLKRKGSFANGENNIQFLNTRTRLSSSRPNPSRVDLRVNSSRSVSSIVIWRVDSSCSVASVKFDMSAPCLRCCTWAEYCDTIASQKIILSLLEFKQDFSLNLRRK